MLFANFVYLCGAFVILSPHSVVNASLVWYALMEQPTVYSTRFASAIAVLLLLCFCCTTVGTTVLFFSLRYQVRKEVKAQLKQGVPEHQLTRFAFSRTAPPADVQWIHEREFRFHGALYDVVRSEQHGDTTVYYCINDYAEQRLFASLDTLVGETLNTSKSAKSGATWAAVKHLIFWALAPSQLQFFFLWKPQPRLPCSTARKTHLCTLSIPTPPPWLVHTT